MTKIFDNALAAVSPLFTPFAGQPPFPEDYHFPISSADIPAIKEALRVFLPDMGTSHRLEIFARIAGHNTAAALQAKLKGEPYCASLAPFLSDTNQTFIHDLLTTHVGGPDVDPRSWVMAHHLHNLVIAWISRNRFGRPHPSDDGALLEDAQEFTGNTEGAMLFEHILETRNLDALIALPGKTMTRALEGLADKEVEDALKKVTHAFALAVAVDATTYQGDFEMCDINRAAEEGKLAYEGGHDDSVSLISAPTKQMAKMIAMVGDKLPDLVYNDAGQNILRGHGELDAQCFSLALKDGLPASLWALSTASLLLSVELGNMPIHVASQRLFGADGHSITNLLPNRDWGQAQSDWRRNIPQAARFVGISEDEAEATYTDILDDYWEKRPLLDFWLQLLSGISDDAHLPDQMPV